MTPRQAFVRAAAAVGVVATVWWLADVAWYTTALGGDVLADAGAPLAVAWLTLGVFVLVGGAALGGVAALAARWGGDRWVRPAQWLRAPRMHAPEGVARVLAALLAAAGLFAFSFVIGRRLVLGMAQPDLTALALAGTHLLTAVAMGLVYTVAARALTPVVRWAVHKPFLGWPWRSAHRVLALAATAATLAVAWVASRHAQLLPYLPWERVVPAAVGIGVGIPLAVAWLRGVRGRVRLGRGAALAAAVVWVSVGAYGVLRLPEDGHGNPLFEEHLGASALGTILVGRMTDVDGDGYRPVLGGGDCAPFDPEIHPGAVDVPGDGIDQDCDGRDLTVNDLVRGWGRWDHPVPETIPRRPPIVLITVEALAARRTHALGYPRETTPHLDALMERGVTFENGFSHGPSTRLSFPALFTGRWTSDVKRRLEGKPPYPIDEGNRMMAEILRDAGYRTAAVVPTRYFTPDRWEGITRGFQDVRRVERKDRFGHVAGDVHGLASDVLQSAASGDAPLFLWAHLYDTHPPHGQPDDVRVFGDELADRYDAELRHVDAHLRMLVDGAREALGPDTLIIVTGDHGISHRGPRHARQHYGFDLHTTSLHVPMLFLAPYLSPRHITRPCTHLEILPTLANLLRLEPPLRFRGESLVPELLGRPPTRPSYVFSQFLLPDDAWHGRDPLRMVSVRTPDHHMVLDRRKGRTSLWEWPVDHDELHDLMGSDEPHVVETAAMLDQLLSAFVYEASKGANDHLVRVE